MVRRVIFLLAHECSCLPFTEEFTDVLGHVLCASALDGLALVRTLWGT